MGNAAIPEWLKSLPLAPEFRPTDTEFADPIAYISKIEKEASAFGICKVIPPLPKPSKRFVYNNVIKSLLKSHELGLDDVGITEVSKRVKKDGGQDRAVFTTRQQELGQNVGRGKGDRKKSVPVAKKQVWQSGEAYTLDEFESKAKGFSRDVLGTVKDVSPLDVEALFWKTAKGKAIYVEYANDVPGSGFGEPEGLLGFFQPRKRRRMFPQSQRGRSYYARNDVSNKKDTYEFEVQPMARNSCPLVKCENGIAHSSTRGSNRSSQCTDSEAACPDVEPEGSAGWKLSNSPWNLQVIARSAGSLTRFMLDNIPGVTTPMVYIGMLFSWFAWHVEDHELHSMNFLHTGSPKTWYAIPGDYAFAFEEVIRQQAYGGDVGHLAALKLLGEKTTLLSPEKLVARGIPCCRLVQNPGEFVVSFPRAYHVGFSHGFNLGEAANFGTPQWLIIAKEAAVRRAAMNHLPMLSHQQLLYLLTMSFISRVPESLLPGVRSSRLRDRLKEGRELLVKKAFIDDVLKENNRLNTLKGRDSSLRVVLWHPDSLPSFVRESLLRTGTSETLFSKDAESPVCPSKVSNLNTDQLMMLRETVDDLYLGDDDLSQDFQVDSGTLPCVVCGILGYPFMCVVQPPKQVSLGLFSAEDCIKAGKVGRKHNNSLSQPFCSATSDDESWATSGILRPRFFCLEHAIQIKELLRDKGGVRMLVICHSDFQKIKANAAALTEEISLSFNYKEVQLESATQEELRLIDVAIDAEELTDVQEDWTSKLGINLRFIAKRGGVPEAEHALKLDYLISVMAPLSRISGIQWWSRKSRTKLDSKRRKLMISDNHLPEKNDTRHESESRVEAKGKVLLQYYRKKFRKKGESAPQ